MLNTVSLNTVVSYVIKAIALIALWYIANLLINNKARWLQHLNEKLTAFQFDERSISVFNESADYVISIMAVLVALHILGMSAPLQSALTAAGVTGIIIAFAAKDIVANFISGIFILLDRPFIVGDAINVNDLSGTVIDISLRTTTIVSWDRIKISIPNNVLATNPVTNYSTAPQRRILFNVPLAIDSDVARAQAVIREVIDGEERVTKDQTIAVRVDNIRDGAVDIQVLCYTTADVLFDTRSDLRREIIQALREQNIPLALPLRQYVRRREM